MKSTHRLPKLLLTQILFVALSVVLTCGQETLHLGRPIRLWLEELQDDSKEKRDLAERELRIMGTNALPSMLAYVMSSAPAFRVLGPTAKPAIPRLVQLVADGNYCSDAANALILIGPDGIQSLAGTLANKDPRIRVCILQTIDTDARQQPLPLRFQAALPAILECAKDTNTRVAMVAMSALGSTTTNEHLRVRAYVQNLSSENAQVRLSAASILGWSGSQSNLAIPALVKALKDTDEKVRERAGISLQAIAPGEAAKAGVKIRQYE